MMNIHHGATLIGQILSLSNLQIVPCSQPNSSPVSLGWRRNFCLLAFTNRKLSEKLSFLYSLQRQLMLLFYNLT